MRVTSSETKKPCNECGTQHKVRTEAVTLKHNSFSFNLCRNCRSLFIAVLTEHREG